MFTYQAGVDKNCLAGFQYFKQENKSKLPDMGMNEAYKEYELLLNETIHLTK